MVGLKVADADGLDFSLVIQLLKGFPGFAVVFNIVFLLVFGNGPMNQIKVQIVQAEPLQRFLEGFFRFFIAVVVIPQLADHSDLLPGDSAFPDPFPHALLVLIKHGGVDQTVAGLQGALHAADRDLSVSVAGAVADAGNGHAVVQKIGVLHAFHRDSPFFMLSFFSRANFKRSQKLIKCFPWLLFVFFAFP